MNPLDGEAVAFLRKMHRVAVASVFALSAVVLIGECIGVDFLLLFFPGVGRTTAPTAIALLFAAVSLWLWKVPQHRKRRRLGQVCGAVVAAVGGWAMVKLVFDWGIGAILTPVAGIPLQGMDLPVHPMAFNSAISVTLAGCALTCLDACPRRKHCPAEWLALAAAFLPFASLVGSIYGVKAATGPFSPRTMVPLTAISLLALSGAILSAMPERGWIALFNRKGPDSVVGRTILPAGISVLVVIGWLAKLSERFGILGYDEETAFLVTCAALAFGLIVSKNMKALRQMDESRQWAERRLCRSEEHLRLALEAAHVGTWEWDLETNQIWHSDELNDFFGRHRGSTSGLVEPFMNLIHPDDREMVERQIKRSIERADDRYLCEFRVLWPDGTVRYLAERGNVMYDKSGKAVRMAGTTMDITERKMLERELIDASNREQRRLGHDLHDDLSQWLTGIHLESRALSMSLKSKSESDAARAEKIVSWASEALQRTRMLVRGMAPSAIETGGLTDALRDLASNAEKMFRIRCQCICDDSVAISNPDLALHLYRIAQEALSNAIRHSEATEVLLRLEASTDGRANLVIRDNGKGLPNPLPKDSGMGLRIMRYRAGLIGATVDFHPDPDGGTEIVCSISPRSALWPQRN